MILPKCHEPTEISNRFAQPKEYINDVNTQKCNSNNVHLATEVSGNVLHVHIDILEHVLSIIQSLGTVIT